MSIEAFAILFLILWSAALALGWLCERITKRWPSGHGESYWSSCKRVDQE
jgi:hypothetical protein